MWDKLYLQVRSSTLTKQDYMNSQDSNSQIQAHKEEARRLALSLGLALERRGLVVETVDQYGNRSVLSQSTDELSVWKDALEAIQAKIAQEKSAATGLEEIYPEIQLYTDGGSRGNPGPSASGFVIYGREGKILEEGGEYLGVTTNNQAEYQALKLALERASRYTKGEVAVYMDSLLVVNQMNGVYKVKNRDLWPVHTSIKSLLAHFSKVTFRHVRRKDNNAADSLVNKILDAQS